MNPELRLQIGKFYRSRDGRIWEVVEKVPEGYSKEKEGSECINSIYTVFAVCHSTKTYNTFTTNGRSHLNYMQLDEDLIEELSGVVVHERKIQFKSADEKKFVRFDGRLFCTDQSDNICTYIHEEMPKEISHQRNAKITGTVLEHFTYEDYCKFYGIQPVYEKNRKEQLAAFLKESKNFAFLGCQKENYTKIIESFFAFYELIEGQKMKEDFFTELMLKMYSYKDIDINKFDVNVKEKHKLVEFFNNFRSIMKTEK